MKVVANNVVCTEKQKRTYDGNDRYYVMLAPVDENDDSGQLRTSCPAELFGVFKRLTAFYDVELAVSSGKSGTYLDVVSVHEV